LKDVETGKSRTIINDERASEPNWLEVDDLFVYLLSEEGNKVSLIIGHAKNLSR
jgi:hypothetical protein